MTNTFSIHKHPILDRSEKMRATALRLGFVCLDTVWVNQYTPYRFVCSKGHMVFKSPVQLRQLDNPCNECVLDRFTQRLRASAKAAGVEVLEEGWLGYRSPHRFRCSYGHTWERRGTPALVSAGCPECGVKHLDSEVLRSKGLQRLQVASWRRGGRCLTQAFSSMSDRFRFVCVQGHTFEASGSSVLRGSWCRQCSATPRLTRGMERLQEVCARREGVCLTQVYAGYSALHSFRCKAGHEWQALAGAVLRGSWCRSCVEARKTVVLDLVAAHRHAFYYGGLCLSTAYVEAPGEMQWSCGFGHSWFASLATIKRTGRWCVQCSMGGRARPQNKARHQVRKKPDAC